LQTNSLTAQHLETNCLLCDQSWDEYVMIKPTWIALVEMNWVMDGEKGQKRKDHSATHGIMNAEGLHLQSGTAGENVPDH
jgi:hypothetical protein